MRLPDPSLPWPVPREVVALIAEREQGPHGGPAFVAYRCPAGVWTIGWGETDGVRPGDRCTPEQADRWLLEDLEERTRAVRDLCTVEPSPNELGAMVSLAYNIGLGAFATSTVLRRHNAGDRQAAARAFALWNKARNPRNGALEVLNGLTIRRSLEAALYLTPESGFERMPQAVEVESKLSASPIAQGGTATVVLGGLAAANELAPALERAAGGLEATRGFVASARGVVEGLSGFIGIPPGLLLAAALIGVGFWVVRVRRQQRREGWA
jgi:lysozyme